MGSPFRVPSYLQFPDCLFIPPRSSLVCMLNPSVLPQTRPNTLHPSSPPTAALLCVTSEPGAYLHCLLWMLFHNLLLHIIYLFTHPSPPLTHGIFNRALYPTGLAHRWRSANTHDFELKIGLSPQLSHGGVCSGWVSLAAVSKAYFFNCWELIELYLLDIGQMTSALQVNGKAVISRIWSCHILCESTPEQLIIAQKKNVLPYFVCASS